MMADIHAPAPVQVHRKLWEWSIGMLALKRLEAIHPDSVVLGVGTGSEIPPFWLSNRVKYVVCTDLYNSEGRSWDEGNPSMLAHPEKFARSKWNRNRLGVMVMDGTDLRFPENSFDAVFSYSSIEHFGGLDAAKKCLKEINRVLKPGGVASITTELHLGGALPQPRTGVSFEMFTRAELESLISASGLKQMEKIDFNPSDVDMRTAIRFPEDVQKLPHIILEHEGIKWGSVHFALTKHISSRFRISRLCGR